MRLGEQKKRKLREQKKKKEKKRNQNKERSTKWKIKSEKIITTNEDKTHF